MKLLGTIKKISSTKTDEGLQGSIKIDFVLDGKNKDALYRLAEIQNEAVSIVIDPVQGTLNLEKKD